MSLSSNDGWCGEKWGLFVFCWTLFPGKGYLDLRRKGVEFTGLESIFERWVELMPNVSFVKHLQRITIWCAITIRGKRMEHYQGRVQNKSSLLKSHVAPSTVSLNGMNRKMDFGWIRREVEENIDNPPHTSFSRRTDSLFQYFQLGTNQYQ